MLAIKLEIYKMTVSNKMKTKKDCSTCKFSMGIVCIGLEDVQIMVKYLWNVDRRCNVYVEKTDGNYITLE